MGRKLTLFLILVLLLMLTSCQPLSETAKKISESRADRTSVQTSETSTSLEPSTSSAEDSTTSTTQSRTTTTTTTKEKKAQIVEFLVLNNDEFIKDISLPQINMELLDAIDAKTFNEEMLTLSKKLILDKSKEEDVSANFEYFDSDDFLAIKVNINKLSVEDESSIDYFAKTIVIDKKEKRALSNDEIIKLAGVDKKKFLDIYYQFLRGLLYMDETFAKDIQKINQIAEGERQNLATHLSQRDDTLAIYFDGDVVFTVPVLEKGGEKYKYIDLVYADSYDAFVNKNKFCAFSKYIVNEELDNIECEEIDLSEGENPSEIMLSFNKSGIIEIERMKYDYASDDVLLESLEHSLELKKGDKILIKLDLKQNQGSNLEDNSKRNSFYRLVFKDEMDYYYVMDFDYTGIDLEYVSSPVLDYEKKMELADDLIKSGINLLGLKLSRVEQLFGSKYKLNQLEDGYYDMFFEDERYPVLRFDGKDKNSTVKRVFSDYNGYNVINEINVGMRVSEVEDLLGGYMNKVIAGNELYESYTMFNIDKYDVYVYGKDSDLISFGMAITYED